MRRTMFRCSVTLVLGLGLAIVLLWGISCLIQPVVAAPGDVITVCKGGGCDHDNVQAAVDAATGGEVIQVATGVYTCNGLSQVVLLGKSVTIRGGYSADLAAWDPDTYSTVLDAQMCWRVVEIAGNVSPTLEALHIVNGVSPASDHGGGIHVLNAHPVISGCRIYDNAASRSGGGVYLDGSTGAELNNNYIYSNTTGWGGGGVGLYGGCHDAALTGNHVYGNEASDGGGIGVDSSDGVMFGANRIYTNTASSSGGGVYMYKSDDAVLLGNRIYDNVANNYGGGVYMDASHRTLVTDSLAYDNTATSGGGVYVENSDGVVLSGSRIYANDAFGSYGGGIYISWSSGTFSTTLTDNWIAGNTSSQFGGGIAVVGDSTLSCTATLRDNHVVGNQAKTGSGGGWGGGLLFVFTDVTMEANRVEYNETDGTGGGVRLEQCAADMQDNVLRDNQAIGVSAGSGGGIYCNLSSAVMTNTVVVDNQVSWGGAAMVARGAYIRIAHTTLARNSGGDGSGVYVVAGGIHGTSPSTISMTNSIVVSHSVGITVLQGMVPGSTKAILDGVLWHDNGQNWGGGGMVTVTHEYNGSPAFLADGYHIGTGSAAVDKGLDRGVPTDVDGDPRPNGILPDLGADELWYKIYFPIVMRESP